MKNPKQYNVSVSTQNKDKTDTTKVCNGTAGGRKLLRDLAKEGLNLKQLEVTGVHEFNQDGELIRVERIV